MKILITGGAGFIGSHLVEYILNLNEGHIIHVWDDYSNSNNNVWMPRFKGDVMYYPLNTAFLKEIHWGHDIIFHLGEYSRVTPSFDDFDRVVESNLRGTMEVLKYWKRTKCKLVYTASSTRFCDNNQNESPYAFTKCYNTEMIKNMAKWFDKLQYSICYLYNVYGPGCEGKIPGYQSVIDVFHKQKLAGEMLTVSRPGMQSRDFTYVGDIVDGLWKAATVGQNKEYHLGTGKQYILMDVAQMISENNWGFIEERRGDRIESRAPNKETKKELGWEPKMDLKRYIRENLY